MYSVSTTESNLFDLEIRSTNLRIGPSLVSAVSLDPLPTDFLSFFNLVFMGTSDMGAESLAAWIVSKVAATRAAIAATEMAAKLNEGFVI